MFASLFVYPAVLKRHQEGPLAAERLAYLERLSALGLAHDTLVRRAVFALCVAHVLAKTPRVSDPAPWTDAEIDELAQQWAAQRVARGRARSPHWPREHFRAAAREFLAAAGKWHPSAPGRSPHHDRIEDFLVTIAERWTSAATQRAGRWQITRFLAWLDTQQRPLERLVPEDIDAYFCSVRARWSRCSIATAGKILQAFLAHAERRGWASAGLARAVLRPRIYRHEGLPPGPSWEQIGAMIDQIQGDEPAALRDRAVLRLFATYGVRSGEVRRLQLDDVDWVGARIRVVRSKTQQAQWLPLEPSVGEALARYVRYGRPASALRTLFLTLRAPYRPLSNGGLYCLVAHHLGSVATIERGRGPHGLRHACARHLLAVGHSFKQVGDHLGHRSPHATGIYAKVDLLALRRVAFEGLGGLR